MRAVLCGYYGMGNGGDEALLASLLQMLPEHITPVVLSGNPSETRLRYGVEAIPRKSLKAIWQAFRQAEAFIWGGGSLMQDATSRINPLYYGGLMKLAQWMGLKTIAWAQGIGPLNHGTSRWLTRWVLQSCKGVSVRDVGSAQLLKTWNLNPLLAPDPVWALAIDQDSAWGSTSVPASPVNPGLDVLADLPSPRIVVALRSHADLTPDRLAVLTAGLAKFQQVTQTSLVLVPFQPSKDFAIATQLATQLAGPHRIVQLAQPTQLKALFQRAAMTIGMRFHALVMAASEGCNSFAISYDPKVSQLMTALKMPGWTLSETEPQSLIPTTAEEICQTWLNQYTQGSPLKDTQIQAYKKQALNHQALLRQIL